MGRHLIVKWASLVKPKYSGWYLIFRKFLYHGWLIWIFGPHFWKTHFWISFLRRPHLVLSGSFAIKSAHYAENGFYQMCFQIMSTSKNDTQKMISKLSESNFRFPDLLSSVVLFLSLRWIVLRTRVGWSPNFGGIWGRFFGSISTIFWSPFSNTRKSRCQWGFCSFELGSKSWLEKCIHNG